MLKPSEFSVGTLAQAQPLSLLLPRNTYEKPIIIGSSDGQAIAVFLLDEGDFRFQSFPSAEAHNWSGLIIPDVSVEVDETSLYDPGHNDIQLGSIVRSGTSLTVAAKSEGWRGSSYLVPLVEGLPQLGDRHSAGFSRWQVVIGSGLEKRVLKTITIGSKEQA